MKKLGYLLICCSLALAMGCEKGSESAFEPATNILVVNAAVDVASAQVNMESRPYYYKTAPKINFGAGAFFYASRRATQVTAVNSADTTKLIFNGPVNFTGKSYTLYLVGQSPAIDTLLREETALPFINTYPVAASADSVVNVRFANLSPNSVPLKVNIKGSSVAEVSSLGYKGIGAFKAYAAKPANTSYIFEVRNSSTDALLLSYTFAVTATNRFKNVMLVVRGLQGTASGANAFGISAVNYF